MMSQRRTVITLVAIALIASIISLAMYLPWRMNDKMETMADNGWGWIVHELEEQRTYIGALPATTFFIERKLEQDNVVIATALYTETVDLSTVTDTLKYPVERWMNIALDGAAQEYVRVWWEDGTWDGAVKWKKYGTYVLDGEGTEYAGDGWYRGREVEARFRLYFPLVFKEGE